MNWPQINITPSCAFPLYPLDTFIKDKKKKTYNELYSGWRLN